MTAARRIATEILSGGITLLREVGEVIDQDQGWQTTAPRTDCEITVRVEARYRWAAYEPNSSHAKRGLTGRWQRQNERGTWETVPAPTGIWREA